MLPRAQEEDLIQCWLQKVRGHDWVPEEMRALLKPRVAGVELNRYDSHVKVDLARVAAVLSVHDLVHVPVDLLYHAGVAVHNAPRSAFLVRAHGAHVHAQNS